MYILTYIYVCMCEYIYMSRERYKVMEIINQEAGLMFMRYIMIYIEKHHWNLKSL